MKEDTYIVPHGYGAAGGFSQAGPYAAVLVLDDTDGVMEMPAGSDDRMHTNVGGPQKLIGLMRDAGGWSQFAIAKAARICGPVCPKEVPAVPVIAWTQRDENGWRLCVRQGDVTRTIVGSSRILRNPLLACRDGRIVAGCESDLGNESRINLYEIDGRPLFQAGGRRGKLAAFGDGWLLLVERHTSEAIWLEAIEIDGSKIRRSVCIRGEPDYTFNADLAVSERGGTACIAAEITAGFGSDCQFGLHREIAVWSLQATEASARPLGLLPVEHRGFKCGMGVSTENLPPIRPMVIAGKDDFHIAYRQFRWNGFKAFGWDVYWTQFTDGAWTEPARLTENVISPDSGCGIIPLGDDFLGVFPELDNSGNSGASSRHRVALVQFGAGRSLPRPEIAVEKRAEYRIPARCSCISPEPPALPDPPRKYTLVWGDMHAHTAYSKCMGAANGMPDEIIRYQRDMLGNRVICITEHTEKMSPSEFIWTYDLLEAEAGDERLIIYGTEFSHGPGRHTNWHAMSRGKFDQLCPQLTSSRDENYRRTHSICDIVALRHHHGDEQRDDALAKESFDGRLEVAMEAMQGRTHNLLGKGGRAGFPAIYLNHGFRIGLVGGTDHFREDSPNHYCLTGFWVEEISARGVWDALLNRRTIAVADGKIAVWATLEKDIMGQEIRTKMPVKIRVCASSARPIRRAALIRDGLVLPWQQVSGNAAEVVLTDTDVSPGYHWYVVTVEAESAYSGPAIAHASPFFVTVISG